MTALQIAAVYVAANILILIWLAARVVSRRVKGEISRGDGGSDDLALAIRVHGNASEYIPGAMVGLVVAALLCPVGLEWIIHVVGGVFTAGRVLHAFGFGRSIVKLRQIGILMTWAAMIGLVGVLLWLALG